MHYNCIQTGASICELSAEFSSGTSVIDCSAPEAPQDAEHWRHAGLRSHDLAWSTKCCSTSIDIEHKLKLAKRVGYTENTERLAQTSNAGRFAQVASTGATGTAAVFNWNCFAFVSRRCDNVSTVSILVSSRLASRWLPTAFGHLIDILHQSNSVPQLQEFALTVAALLALCGVASFCKARWHPTLTCS